jgi:SAM-dependent methyltransferase
VNCRGCGGRSFGQVIDLGPMPLVNNLLAAPDQPCPCWPLKVVFCRECSLAQLTETPPPEAMFGEYLYFSSQSHTMLNHAGDLVRRFVRPGQRVVEIASNDGYLLRQARDRGAIVLGIDPARNIAEYAIAQGVPTRCEFFDSMFAQCLRDEWGRADVIFANNVLAHVPDPGEIALGIRHMLAPEGIAHIEVPSLTSMVDHAAFDTIYHEHQCYFSLTALHSIFSRAGLSIIDAQNIEIHGGSLHVQVGHASPNSSVDAILRHEQSAGVGRDDYYRHFADRVSSLRRELVKVMAEFKTVVACGAAAKGVVLLNTFQFDCNVIPWVTDVSPHKQGRYIPGTGQLVVDPQKLVQEMPGAALILPWNIKEEIIERNAEYRRQGGEFIVPLPQVKVIR